MKITDVEVIKWNPGVGKNFIFLKLSTDAGITGWGEINNMETRVACALAESMGEMIVGENPTRVEHLWQRMFRSHRNLRNGGLMVHTISAIDMALWDIAGKHFGAPVCELLGGPFTSTLKAYISGLRQPTFEAQLQAALAFKEQGFSGIKLFLGWNPKGGAAKVDFRLKDARIFNIPTNPTDIDGQKYYINSIFVIEAAGLCVAHLGNLNHLLGQ